MSRCFAGAAFALLLFASPAFAQPVSVSVDDIIEWDNIAVASYQVQVENDITGLPVIPFDPPTNDPDGDKIVDVPKAGGLTSEVSLAIFLTGQNTGSYTFQVRSVDSNGNVGAWASLAISYDPPPPPLPRKK